ncbi:MAG TPA: hypothetical protein VIV57_24470 [Anaeromyxobacter sp.]
MRERASSGRRGRATVAMAVAAALLGACRTPVKPYAAPALRQGERKKMAILPFENLSKAPGAGKTLEGMVLVEFLKRAPITIVDPGEVAAALSKERVRIATSMSRETLDAVAKDLGVDLVLVGTLHDYDMQAGTGTTGQIPVLAVTLRVIDARGGDILWAANASRRGTDRESVFGIGRVYSLDILAEQTAAEMAAAFGDSMRNR